MKLNGAAPGVAHEREAADTEGVGDAGNSFSRMAITICRPRAEGPPPGATDEFSGAP